MMNGHFVAGYKQCMFYDNPKKWEVPCNNRNNSAKSLKYIRAEHI